MSINSPRPAAAVTMDITTLWVLQPHHPALPSILMHKTQQPGWRGCGPCRCPLLLTGDEAHTDFWRRATLLPGLWVPGGIPRVIFYWMPYIEVGMCSQMMKTGGQGAWPDAALAPLCSPRRGERLICTHIPAAQHLPPHPHLPSSPPLQKLQLYLWQEHSRAARRGQAGKRKMPFL